MLDRIPYEIFKQIIQSSNVSEPVSLFSGSFITLPPINASHVCRSWRTALLSDPTMWTCLRIPQMPPDEIYEILRRSKSALLELYIEPFRYFTRPKDDQAHIPSSLSSVFQEMHRFRILQINVPFKEYTDKLTEHVFPYLQHPAPALRTFRFDVQEREWATGKEFLQTLFSGHAPELSHVTIPIYTGLPDLLSSPLFRNLSSLRLDLRVETVINGDTLADILELSPHLRVFQLGWARKSPSVVLPISSDRRVHLRDLQRLLLRGNSVLVNLFLEHLVFPFEKVSYSITFRDLDPGKFDTALLVQFLARRRLTFLSISMAFSQNQLFIEFFERYPRTEENNSVFGVGYSNTYKPAENLPKFLQIFELSHIKHLFLLYDQWEYITLRRIFILLINLEHLRIYHNVWSRTSFLTALIPHPQ